MLSKLKNLRGSLVGNKWVERISVIYLFVVLTYQLLYLIVPFRQMILALHLSFVSPSLAVIGFGIFLWDFLIDRNLFKEKLYSWLLIGIIAVMCLSTLLNFRNGIIVNAKAIVWQISQMLVIFPIGRRLDFAKLKKPISAWILSVTLIFNITNIISLVQMYALIGYTAEYDGGILRQGFVQARLFGVYGSTHFASVFMIMLAAVAVLIAVKATKKLIKAYFIITAVLAFLYVVASGTRAVIVAIACAAFITVLFIVYNYFSYKKCISKLLKALVCVVLSLVAAVTSFYAIGLCDDAMKSVMYLYASDDSTDDELELELERADVDSENISNHRFEIWGNYFSIMAEEPSRVVLGMAPGSYMSSIKEEYSDLFIVKYIKDNYPFMYENNLIYDTHNAYVGAFVMAGAVGVVLLLIFIVLGFLRTVRYFRTHEKPSIAAYLLLALIVVMLSASFFESDLFFRCTSTSVIFWMSVGMLLKYTPNDGKRPERISK